MAGDIILTMTVDDQQFSRGLDHAQEDARRFAEEAQGIVGRSLSLFLRVAAINRAWNVASGLVRDYAKENEFAAGSVDEVSAAVDRLKNSVASGLNLALENTGGLLSALVTGLDYAFFRFPTFVIAQTARMATFGVDSVGDESAVAVDQALAEQEAMTRRIRSQLTLETIVRQQAINLARAQNDEERVRALTYQQQLRDLDRQLDQLQEIKGAERDVAVAALREAQAAEEARAVAKAREAAAEAARREREELGRQLDLMASIRDELRAREAEVAGDEIGARVQRERMAFERRAQQIAQVGAATGAPDVADLIQREEDAFEARSRALRQEDDERRRRDEQAVREQADRERAARDAARQRAEQDIELLRIEQLRRDGQEEEARRAQELLDYAERRARLEQDRYLDEATRRRALDALDRSLPAALREQARGRGFTQSSARLESGLYSPGLSAQVFGPGGGRLERGVDDGVRELRAIRQEARAAREALARWNPVAVFA